jgi:hypothetical protein
MGNLLVYTYIYILYRLYGLPYSGGDSCRPYIFYIDNMASPTLVVIPVGSAGHERDGYHVAAPALGPQSQRGGLPSILRFRVSSGRGAKLLV